MRYSPSENAFFDPKLQARYVASGTWPNDLIPIEDAEYADLLAQRASGKVIVAENGRPAISDPEPPSIESRRAGMKVSRAQAIAVLGEANWSIIEAVASDPATDWPVRAFILHAETWHRTSPTLNALAPLLSLSDDDMDDLFNQAAAMQL